MPLCDIQKAFKDFILSNDYSLENMIQDSSLFNAKRRLIVYKNTSSLTLKHCVKDIYPMCEKLLDENAFSQLVERFIKTHPNKRRDLTFYGDQFYQYLALNLACQHLPFLADLAELEWAIYRAYYADDDPIWPQQSFVNASAKRIDDITLCLSDSISLLVSGWPTLKFYQHLNDDTIFDIDTRHSYLIVHRKHSHGEAEEIPVEAWRILKDIQCKKSLAELIETHGQRCESWLPRFIHRRWVVSFGQTND